AEQAQLPPAGEGGEGQAQVECEEQSQPVAESAEAANTPAEGAEAVKVPAVEGSDAAQPPAEGAEAIQAPGDDAGTAPPPGEGAEAAGDAADGEEKVPALVKVVHSARSVFRQRDQKEYDPFTAHLERRITKLFEALDTEGTGRVDVHELGTLIRSVGCCPSESDLQEMVTQLEEEGQPGLIRLETVMPYIIQCVEDRKYPSATAEQLLQAFEVLAEEQEGLEEIVRGPSGPAKKEKKEEDEGTIPQDKLVHILTEEGEHFSQEEVEEMLSVVSASDSARVDYTEFVKQLVVPELW
ncbi:dynein regulatory complex protein 8-like, partial [Pollicipes pollicipes]